MYFETKVRYTNTDGKLTTEPYLVDALTCTEAEARIIDKLTPFRGDLEVTSVKQSKITEIVFNPDASYWWLVKVDYPSVDPKSGVEKHNITPYLVQADGFAQAKEALDAYMAKTMADWSYASLALTPIIDVFSAFA